MSRRTSATRYAKALLEVALQEADPAQVEQSLGAIVSAMNEHADLRRAMTSPGVAPSARAGVVKAVSEKVAAPMPLAKLLALLADRGRLELLPDLFEVYRERLLTHRNVVQATVTSAAPLPADKVKALAATLSGLTGKQVQLETAVDPSMLGGIITRIGSTVYDGSLRTQLQKMKQQLVDNA